MHGVGGILGTFLVGIFCAPGLGVFSGLGFGAGNNGIGAQLGVQAVGILVTALYTAVVTWGLLKLAGRLTGGLRVSEEQETEGLDLVLHDERGYDLN